MHVVLARGFPLATGVAYLSLLSNQNKVFLALVSFGINKVSIYLSTFIALTELTRWLALLPHWETLLSSNPVQGLSVCWHVSAWVLIKYSGLVSQSKNVPVIIK